MEKVEKVFFGGWEAQPLRAAHGAPLARREPARGREKVANVGMLPVLMLPMANGARACEHGPSIPTAKMAALHTGGPRSCAVAGTSPASRMAPYILLTRAGHFGLNFF